MPPKEINIPQELKQAIKKDKLIIFVGAGLSYDLKNTRGEQLEGWENLVLKILLHLEEKEFEVTPLIKLSEKYDPITILNLIESDKLLTRSVITEFVRDFIHLSKENNFSLHKKIYQLSNKIITTNYDRAFELAVEELERNTAYKGKNYELTKHKESHASLLFKLHGCCYHADSMVLFPTQYQDLYNNPNKDAEHALLVFKNIIINKSVLFIGCGMGDFQINNFFKKIKELQGDYNQKHFIIDTKPLDSSLNFLLHIPIKEYSEIPDVIEKLLEEKEKFKQQKTDREQALEMQVTEIKEKLVKAQEELKYTTDDVERMRKLLEREALKYLGRGLEFQLDNEPEKAIDEYKVAIELKPDLHQAFNNWGIALGEMAKTKSGVEAETLSYQAIEKYKKAIEIKPNNYESFHGWGNILINLARTKPNEEKEILYQKAIKKFQKTIEIKLDYHSGFYGLGMLFGNLAKIKSGEAAEALLNQAIEKYEKAVEIKHDHYRAFNNWGLVLDSFALTKTDKEKEVLLKEAIKKFQKAIEIKPDYYQAFNHWGAMLNGLARTKSKSGEDKEALLQEAIKKYQEAIEVKPDFAKAIKNWGTAMGDLAKTKSGKAAENLYYQAFEKFQKAIEIKPDYHEAFYNWGTDLLNLAKTKSGKDTKILLKEALERFQKSIEIKSDKYQAVYNLACTYALLSNKENALSYLEQSLENKEVTTDIVLQDEDWQPYLNDKDFKKIIKKYKST